MVQENEIAMLLFGMGILVFILMNRKKLQRIPSWKYLAAGFNVLLAGWVFTVVETFLPYDALNILEHLCYAASSVILAVWCGKSFYHKSGVNK